LDLTSDDRFWLVRDGPGVSFDPLPGNRGYDVAINGADVASTL
jgi:hypothetical protein